MGTMLHNFWPQIKESCIQRITKDGSAGMYSVIHALKESGVIDKIHHNETDEGVEALSQQIIRESKFRYQKHWLNGELYIVENPNYELSEMTKRTQKIQRAVLVITTGVSVVTLIISILNFVAKK